jgi:hypothetical protein
MTITTVGYGDLKPTTTTEYWTCSVVMFVGCCSYAFLVGSIVSSLSNANPARNDFLRDIENLDELAVRISC